LTHQEIAEIIRNQLFEERTNSIPAFVQENNLDGFDIVEMGGRQRSITRIFNSKSEGNNMMEQIQKDPDLQVVVTSSLNTLRKYINLFIKAIFESFHDIPFGLKLLTKAAVFLI